MTTVYEADGTTVRSTEVLPAPTIEDWQAVVYLPINQEVDLDDLPTTYTVEAHTTHHVTRLPGGGIVATYITHDPYPDHPLDEAEGVEWATWERASERDEWLEGFDTFRCDACGKIGSEDDYCYDGDECPDEDCEGTTHRIGPWVGNPRFFWIDRCEHVLVRYAVHYAVHDTVDYHHGAWDTAPRAGYIIVPADVPEDQAAEYTKGLLDAYSAYCNGSTYGIVTERFRGCVECGTIAALDGHTETRYGWYGLDSAEEELPFFHTVESMQP